MINLANVEKIKQQIQDHYNQTGNCRYLLEYLDGNGEEIAEAFHFLPGGVAEVYLGHTSRREPSSSQSEIFVSDYIKILQALPATVTSLFLAVSDQPEKTAEEWAQILRVIPVNVVKLQIASAEFSDRSASELAKMLISIPPCITSFVFPVDSLEDKTIAELEQISAAITASIIAIDLSGTYLGDNETARTVAILSHFSSNVGSLDLSWNYLGNKTTEECKQIFSAVQSGVRFIDLSNNQLVEAAAAKLSLLLNSQEKSKQTAKLIEILNTFKSRVTVDLSYNGLDKISDEEINELLKSIPDYVNIIVEDNHQITNLIAANKQERAKIQSLVDDKIKEGPAPLVMEYLGKIGLFAEEEKLASPLEPQPNDYPGPACG